MKMLATITSCVPVQHFSLVLSTMSGVMHATSCWDFGSVSLSCSGTGDMSMTIIILLCQSLA